jgi:hypothetical protein
VRRVVKQPLGRGFQVYLLPFNFDVWFVSRTEWQVRLERLNVNGHPTPYFRFGPGVIPF